MATSFLNAQGRERKSQYTLLEKKKAVNCDCLQGLYGVGDYRVIINRRESVSEFVVNLYT